MTAQAKQTDLATMEGNGYFDWAVPEALEVPTDPLRMRLDFHGEAVVLRSFEGKIVTTKIVSAMDVAHALSRELEISSGLLPNNALWWSNTPKGAVIALWEPPRVRRVALQEQALGTPTRYDITFPGLVFLCRPAETPYVFAVKRRPAGLKDVVYRAPFFNVFDDGRVCPGSHKFPQNVSDIPDSFFRSFFSTTGDHNERSKTYPRDLKKRWEAQDGKATWPVKDLVEHSRLADIMALGGR